jgi:hypothetical protein
MDDTILRKLAALRYERDLDMARADAVLRLRELVQMLPYATDDEQQSALLNECESWTKHLGNLESVGAIGRSMLAAHGIAP